MNACQFPVFLLMTGGALLSFLVAWLWAAPQLKNYSRQLGELQRQFNDLQLEKFRLEKSLGECQRGNDLRNKQVEELKNELLKSNEENKYLHGENKMLETRVKTLEVILKEMEDL